MFPCKVKAEIHIQVYVFTLQGKIHCFIFVFTITFCFYQVYKAIKVIMFVKAIINYFNGTTVLLSNTESWIMTILLT